MMLLMSSLHGTECCFYDSNMSSNKPSELPTVSPLSDARVRHDIRASLAISKGMCQALEGSFDELCESSKVDSREERLNRVEKLENECRFCLSRIQRSVAQLDSMIEALVPGVSPAATSGFEGADQ